mgnify:CR=1 FL=1
MKKDLLTIHDLSRAEIEKLLDMLERGDYGGLTDDRSRQQPSNARSFRRAVR